MSDSCYEIIIVENQAMPGMSIAEPLPQGTRVIELSDNQGTTGSINRACEQSKSKYVLILNNDVELQPDFLATLVSVLEEDQACAFATGKLLSARDTSRLDGAGDAVIAGGGAYRLGHDDLDVGQYEQARRVIAGCGAATLVRRSVLDEVAGLDEDFFAYLDDVDLGLRIQLRGYHGMYVPRAVAFHFGSATLGGNALHPKIVEWVTRNQILLLLKDYPVPVLVKLAPRILVFQLLWFLFALVRRRAIAHIKGNWGAAGLVPRIIGKRRKIMRERRITNEEFITALLTSEQQVYNWFKSQAPRRRSTLLNIYFLVFRTGKLNVPSG